MRSFNINFNIGDFRLDKTGIILKSRFGIIDVKCEPAFSIKEKMQFTDKECFLNLKFNLDSDVNGDALAEKV